jgi:hypothetical protein
MDEELWFDDVSHDSLVYKEPFSIPISILKRLKHIGPRLRSFCFTTARLF